MSGPRLGRHAQASELGQLNLQSGVVSRRGLTANPAQNHIKELARQVNKIHLKSSTSGGKLPMSERPMVRPRLPVRAIAVFEAVARLGSFKSAAEEMNLTPSAVSHQIRALEQELGLELFLRDGRGVKVSPDAVEYADRLHGLLDHMRAATDEVAARGNRQATTGTVRIMTPPSLATHWLIPRLPLFMDAHPGIDIRVFAVRTADGNAADYDITIGYGDVAQRGSRPRPLLQETYVPYCAPSRLNGAAQLDARALLAMPLIRSRDNVLSWDTWFARHGLTFEPWAVQQLQVDPSYVAIEAAVKGVGVILESSILTREHVEAGRLVAMLPEQERPTVSYWLLPLGYGARGSTRIAYEWLLSQGNCAS